MADVGLAVQRAIDKTESMKARADAVGELEQAGTFDDPTQLDAGDSDLDRQLAAVTNASEVDAEIAKMKAELGTGTARAAPQQLRPHRLPASCRTRAGCSARLQTLVFGIPWLPCVRRVARRGDRRRRGIGGVHRRRGEALARNPGTQNQDLGTVGLARSGSAAGVQQQVIGALQSGQTDVLVSSSDHGSGRASAEARAQRRAKLADLHRRGALTDEEFEQQMGLVDSEP